MTTEVAKILIQAFISCHLDYYNSLYGAYDGLIQKIQSILNAATCLITGARRCDNIMYAPCQLHRLPVQ